MFNNFIHLKQSIQNILFNEKSLEGLYITENEWLKLERYLKIFEIFRKPTTVLQG